MRINRRTLCTVTAGSSLLTAIRAHGQTPNPSATPQGGIPRLETGDVRVLSIAPDASTLFGVSEQNEVVFLAADTLKEISRSEAFPEAGIIDTLGISWSPHSARAAFSLDGWRLARDSDIFIATVETGETVNATAEGHREEAGSMLEPGEGPVDIDISPVWLDDDTILFGRHQLGDGYLLTIVTLTLATGEIATWLEFDPAEVAFLTNMLTLLDGGSVAFAGGDARSRPIIVVASQDGTVDIVDTGEVETAFPYAIGNSTIVISDPRNFTVARISYDGSTEPEPLADVFHLNQGNGIIAGPAYGPDGESLVGLTQDRRVVVADAGGVRDIAKIEGDVGPANVFWVDGAVLIAGGLGAWLVPIP